MTESERCLSFSLSQVISALKQKSKSFVKSAGTL